MRLGPVGGDRAGGAAFRPADDPEPRRDPAALVGEDAALRRDRAARDAIVADAGDDEIGGKTQLAAGIVPSGPGARLQREGRTLDPALALKAERTRPEVEAD